jgi:hypothetical protein
VTDVVIWAGPVMLLPAHRAINWQGRDVRIVLVQGEGSSNMAALGSSLRDASGRILPNLLAKYAPGIKPEKIALCAFSAGHGLLNQILSNDADRAAVSAVVLSDADFNTGNPAAPSCSSVHEGYVKFGIEAAKGAKLLVATTSNSTDGTYLSGRQSFDCELRQMESATGHSRSSESPAQGVKSASGGWWRLGNAHWGDYTQPGSPVNAGNDITHGDHANVLSPQVWQAYLAPHLASSQDHWGTLFVAGALAAALYWLHKRQGGRGK